MARGPADLSRQKSDAWGRPIRTGQANARFPRATRVRGAQLGGSFAEGDPLTARICPALEILTDRDRMQP